MLKKKKKWSLDVNKHRIIVIRKYFHENGGLEIKCTLKVLSGVLRYKKKHCALHFQVLHLTGP